MCSSSVLSEMRSPQAMFTTWPVSLFLVPAARRLALTVLSMKQKSRVCSPSPKTVGRVLAIAALMKFGMTAAYWLFGSWRGPNTLKYRRLRVSIP